VGGKKRIYTHTRADGGGGRDTTGTQLGAPLHDWGIARAYLILPTRWRLRRQHVAPVVVVLSKATNAEMKRSGLPNAGARVTFGWVFGGVGSASTTQTGLNLENGGGPREALGCPNVRERYG
jgi:hypothetical protein